MSKIRPVKPPPAGTRHAPDDIPLTPSSFGPGRRRMKGNRPLPIGTRPSRATIGNGTISALDVRGRRPGRRPIPRPIPFRSFRQIQSRLDHVQLPVYTSVSRLFPLDFTPRNTVYCPQVEPPWTGDQPKRAGVLTKDTPRVHLPSRCTRELLQRSEHALFDRAPPQHYNGRVFKYENS